MFVIGALLMHDLLVNFLASKIENYAAHKATV